MALAELNHYLEVDVNIHVEIIQYIASVMYELITLYLYLNKTSIAPSLQTMLKEELSYIKKDS